jgi:hypothetical protein
MLIPDSSASAEAGKTVLEAVAVEGQPALHPLADVAAPACP